MAKKFYFMMAALMIVALLFGACKTTPAATEEVVEPKVFKACQVTDTGGIDDRSFNETAWKGLEDAEEMYGVEIKYLESQQQTDYEVNLNAMVEDGCDLIIPVGFLLADATAAVAAANPDVPFAIIDVDWVAADNVLGSTFKVSDVTYLAGYLSAAMTETGVVGTYGGMNISSVTAFMDGYVMGVEKYNEMNGTSVVVKGWDVNTQEGLFTGNFESTDDGRTITEALMDEGADIIMPVAGPVGAGTLAALEARGNGYMIGVDSDWSYAYADSADFILASALKGMDNFVLEAVEMTMEGNFAAGNWTGTLDNGGVDLVYGSTVEDSIPADVKATIEDLKAQLSAGTLSSMPVAGEETAVTLGTEENPIVWVVVPSGETEKVVASFEAAAGLIYDETGLVIEPMITTDYTGAIEALCATPAHAQMSSLATFAYILAADRGCAEAALVAERYGSAANNGQIMVRVDSGIETLADLEGKTLCRPDPLSTSGWIVPSIELRAAGLDPDTDFAQIVDAGSHDASVLGLYNGDCDAATSYADARSTIEEDYPDVLDVIKVIHVSAGIPNDGVQFVTGFDPVLKQQIIDALLAIAATEEGQAVLQEAYSWNALGIKDDSFYDPFRQVLDAAGVDVADLQ